MAAVRGVPTVSPEPPEPPASKPEPPSGGVKEWIQKHLKNLANTLKKLSFAALGALPSVIGSIVSWLLKMAGNEVGWLAKHVWTLAVGVGTLLIA